jgi:DNA polymerase-3 subunit epsilon
VLSDFTIVDLETTGPDPLAGRITEIAARRYRNGKLAGALAVLVKTGVEPEPQAVALNGLTADTLDRHGLPEETCLSKLFLLLGDSVLVAHNAAFELCWLHQAKLRLGWEPLTSDFLCTKTLAVELTPGLRSYALGKLTEHYGIQWTGAAHRAMPDVQATKSLLDLFLTRPDVAGVCEQLLNCCGANKDGRGAHYPLPAGLPDHAREIKQ